MKCENCGTGLVGASIVCRQCNHNVAQGRVGQWRARQSHVNPAAAHAAATRTISPLPSPKPGAKTQQVESNNNLDVNSPGLRPQTSVPLHPKTRINPVAVPKSSPAKSSAASSDEDPGVVQFPAWRSQLKDKVKEVRERRTQPIPAADAQPDEAQLDPNPIVESALKRIRWSQHIAPPQSQTERNETKPQLAQQQTSAVKPQAEAPVAPQKPDTNPLQRTTRSSTNPLLARKPLAQPTARTEATPQPVPRPETKQPLQPAIEDRIEIKPAAKPESKPGSGSLPAAPKPGSGSLTATPKPGSGSLIATPKVRTTGEIKKPVVTQQVQPPRTPSGSLVQPPRNHVETQVIGLAPSVSDLTAYASGVISTTLKPRQATLWGRTLAGACDFEIVAMAYLPVFWPYAVLNTSVGYESAAILFVLLAALMFIYQLLTLTIANRTTGMAFLRLRLVNAANREKPVTFLQKFLRALAATASAFLPPLNFLVMQSNLQHRSLPDLISGTMLLERVKSN
ncbi:MAG: RDD family protein [Acidobacteria bacterium]|nr:RDD family protein [Acidobacteriota bacterium]